MLFTITNEINLALISIDIAPSTLIALSTLTATYLYITQHPKPFTSSLNTIKDALKGANKDDDDNDPRPRPPVRRPSLLRRLTRRLRARKQRAIAVAALPEPSYWALSLASLGLPLRQRPGVGPRRQPKSLWRRIQPPGLAAR